jgi:vancomycin permeability regulator SanA
MSFFNSIGKTPQMPVNGFQNMMQRFQQFQRMFTGDAEKQVKQLLSSGKVSKQQYDDAVKMANQFRQMMGGK